MSDHADDRVAGTANGMIRRAARLVSLFAVAFLVGFRLPWLQMLLARYAEVADFDGPYEAGNERVVTVGPTVTLWFCALAAPLAVGLVVVVFRTGLPSRLLGAAAATVGVFSARAAIVDDVSPQVREWTADALVTGVVLGLVVAALVALLPELGSGVAVHAGVLWILALLLPGAQMFAGLVFAPWPPRGAIFLLAAVLIASGCLAYRVVRHGRHVTIGVLPGVIGPGLAAIVYPISPYPHILWDQQAAGIAAALGVGALVTAGIGAAVGYRQRTAVQ